MPGKAPPCFPRQIFVDAFRAAARPAVHTERRRITIRRDLFTHAAAAELWRVRGHAIIASFNPDTRPSAMPARAKLDPIAQALLDEPQIGRLLGQLAARRDDLAPGWLEIDRESPAPSVRILYRGAIVPGDPITRRLDDEGRIVRVAEAESARAMSMEDLRAAAEIAMRRLERIGVEVRGFRPEVMRIKVPGFMGGVATIGLKRAPPPLRLAASA